MNKSEKVGGDEIDRLLDEGIDRSEKRHRRKNRRRSRSGHRHRSKRRRSRSFSGSDRESSRRSRRKRDLIDRDECTIFACHIHPAVDDKDIFDFFSQCGKVRDIVLMRDNHSGTSKGYCYIEFHDKESVVNALTFNGQYLGGNPIMVSVSNAEKNRVARATTNKTLVEAPAKLYISNIAEDLTAEDLQPVFDAFGVVESIDVDKEADKNTHTKNGCVEFRTHSEATFALTNLKNIVLLGKTLKISQKNLSGGANPIGGIIPGLNPNLLDEGQGGLQLNPNSRVMLMQRLQARSETDNKESSGKIPAGDASVPVQKKIVSRFVLLKNMFDPEKETDPNWDIEIEEDVTNECSKFGVVEKCLVDRNSLGYVYITFKEDSNAKDAVNQLNGRWFAQKQIAAEILPPDVFQRMCPKFVSR